MLLKTAQSVFVAASPALAYRPYSKTCPTPEPPHTKRWVTKTVCGTYSVFVFYAHDFADQPIQVRMTTYSVEGANIPSVVSPAYDTSKETTPANLISSGPYCTTVTVYE